MCIHNGETEYKITKKEDVDYIINNIRPFDFPNITWNNKDVRVSKTFGFVSQFPECVKCGTSLSEIWVVLEHGRRNFSAISENGKELTLDHIVPRAKNGLNSYINFQTMCHDCNNIKGHLYNKGTKPVLSFKQAKEMLEDFNVKGIVRRLNKFADSRANIYYDKLFTFEEIIQLFRLKMRRKNLIQLYDHYLIPKNANRLTYHETWNHESILSTGQ